MANDTIKLAGPDAADNYRVLATKGTLKVRPGELYTQRYVQDYLLSRAMKMRCDVSIIIPRFDENEKAHGLLSGSTTGAKFVGTPVA